MAKSYGQSQSGKDIVTFDSLQPHLDGLEDDLNEEIEKKVSSSDLFDANGKVKSGLLPSFVDDVLEFASRSAFPATGESGKIYIALDTNKTYRWGGSTYVEIAAGLALGETTGTAYEGSKGKANATNIATLLSYFVEGVAKVAAKLSHKITFKGGVVGTFDGSEDKEVTIPSALSDLTPDATHRTVTDTEKAGWNAKYDKPSGGIPNSHLEHSSMTIAGNNVALGGSIGADTIVGAASASAQFAGTAEKAKNATSATNAINAENDSKGNPIHTTYETKTDSENKEVTSATFDATKLTLTKRGGGKVEVDVPTFNQNTTGKAATAGTADEAKNLTEDAPTIVDETFTTKTLTEQNEVVEVQALKGNSVVWNQLVKNAKLVDGLRDWLSTKSYDIMDGFTRFYDINGSIWLLPTGLETKMSHIYLWSVRVRASVGGESGSVAIYSNSRLHGQVYYTDSFATYNVIITNVSEGSVGFSTYPTPQSEKMDIAFITIIDLTLMFGAGNEIATYEEFLARKPKVADEFAYDEGSIINFAASALTSTKGGDVSRSVIDVTKLRSKTGELIFPDGMRKAGSACDEIVGNKAIKRLGVKVFDGTEYWQASGKLFFTFDFNRVTDNLICNNYKTTSIGGVDLDDKTINTFWKYYASKNSLWLKDTSFSSVADFKSHLADLYAQGNPLTVIYELASPIEYELEDALTIALPALQGSTLEVVGENTAPLNATMAYYKNARKVMRDLIGAMSNYMSRQRDEVVNGIKDFINGIKVAGHAIWYDATNDTLMMDGNVAATGGLSSGGIQQARSTRGATGFVAEIDATANVPVSIENEVGTTNIVVSVYDRTNNAMVLADVVISPTQITVTTTQTKQLKVVVIGL